ncbi:MAG: fibronectin type III domain-containing protein, partial [Cyclobacteriaceae bacterium]|nr:fibronectin type III domain-containing protein [Cyclobacteriaceae bacterium]
EYKAGTEIEYGLFTLENGTTGSLPVNTFQFQVGSQPEYPLGAEFNAEQTGHKVKLNWQVPKDQYKSYRILNGFHIDKKLPTGEVLRLSEHPIWMKTGEKTGTVIFNDKIEEQQQFHYILRAVTIFNTETKGEEFPFTPKKQIDFSSFSPELRMSSMGDNYEDGVEFIWSDSIYANLEVDRFVLQKKESVTSPWENIESDLDHGTFYYNYQENLVEEQNYYFRVVVVLKNNRELWSNQVRVYKKKE